jgi:hypothetical protein
MQGLLAVVLLWHPVAVIAGDALAETNLPIAGSTLVETNSSIVVHKTVQDRPQSATQQPELYFGSRIKSVTTTAAPQSPLDSNYANVLHSYHTTIIGFRLTLTSHAYLFVGVGLGIPDDLLEQGLGQNLSTATIRIQNSLVMQTEYGLGWKF